MKLGLDLDDTITELPEFFSVISRALIAAGHEIHIITYRNQDSKVVEQLAALNIQYTKIHLPPARAEMSAWKLEIIKSLGLNIYIDDMPENLVKLPPTVRRLWLCDPNIYDLAVCIKAMKG